MDSVSGYLTFMVFLLSAICLCFSEDVDLSKEISAEDFLRPVGQEFHGIEIPKVFIAYDLNRDHKISLIELSQVTSTEKENARMPFKEADVNGEDYLTVEEFTDAPWLFDANDVVINV